MNNWRKKPTGITIPATWMNFGGRLLWNFGIDVHKVRFADHRSGWCGINVSFNVGPWSFVRCILRWNPRTTAPEPIYTLQQQIQDTHGDHIDNNQEIEDRNRLCRLNEIVMDGIRQQKINEAMDEE